MGKYFEMICELEEYFDDLYGEAREKQNEQLRKKLREAEEYIESQEDAHHNEVIEYEDKLLFACHMYANEAVEWNRRGNFGYNETRFFDRRINKELTDIQRSYNEMLRTGKMPDPHDRMHNDPMYRQFINVIFEHLRKTEKQKKLMLREKNA